MTDQNPSSLEQKLYAAIDNPEPNDVDLEMAKRKFARAMSGIKAKVSEEEYARILQSAGDLVSQNTVHCFRKIAPVIIGEACNGAAHSLIPEVVQSVREAISEAERGRANARVKTLTRKAYVVAIVSLIFGIGATALAIRTNHGNVRLQETASRQEGQLKEHWSFRVSD